MNSQNAKIRAAGRPAVLSIQAFVNFIHIIISKGQKILFF